VNALAALIAADVASEPVLTSIVCSAHGIISVIFFKRVL